MKHINVLVFPGTNCEVETARMIRAAGFASKIFRWNESPEEIFASDGLVIPGGFSYEDRGRSGVIAASSPIRTTLQRMAEVGKPILGICNGAQVLVETGLVPGLRSGKTEMALARNRRQKDGEILGSGYFHEFIHAKPTGKPCAWTNYDGVLRLPIAHGEGRFIAEESVLEQILAAGQNVMTYCDASGSVDEHFPVNPNGSLANLAAVCNPHGNVMAMMPHPERVPEGIKIFESLHTFFAKEQGSAEVQSTAETLTDAIDISTHSAFPLEIFVSTKITDNAERTIEWAVRSALENPEVTLQRSEYWGIATSGDLEALATRLLNSGEFFNDNKEIALVRIGNRWFRAEEKELVPFEKPAVELVLLAMEKDDIVGEEKTALVKKHLHVDVNIRSGVMWGFSQNIDTNKLLDSALLGNPISWDIHQIQ